MRVSDYGMDIQDMGENDLLPCSPTLMGFSLNDKFWG